MEDAENSRRELSEQVMLKIINACRVEGEQRFGRELFDAVISEYE